MDRRSDTETMLVSVKIYLLDWTFVLTDYTGRSLLTRDVLGGLNVGLGEDSSLSRSTWHQLLTALRVPEWGVRQGETDHQCEVVDCSLSSISLGVSGSF